MNGIKIPNLCFDKRLRPYGGCRLCVVEAEGQPRLFGRVFDTGGPGHDHKDRYPQTEKGPPDRP